MDIDHTQFPPEKWQEILQLAITDLRINPRDAEALQAIRDANEALNAYEQPAIQAGVNAEQPVRSALQGLAKVPGDALRGIANTFAHPIQTIMDIPKIPGAIWDGLSSGDPEQIARTVGNVGAMAVPFAKAKGSLSTVPFTAASRAAAAGGRTVGAMAGDVATRPFKAVGDMLARPALRNKLTNAQIEGANLSNETMRANLQKPPVRVKPMAEEQLIGRQLQNELLKQRLESGLEPLPDGAMPMPEPVAPPAMTPVAPRPIPEPMPGFSNPKPVPDYPYGTSVEGPPMPPARTTPTIAEMHQGYKEPPIAPKPKGKGVEFSPRGQKSAFSDLIKDEIKQLLGDIARTTRGN